MYKNIFENKIKTAQIRSSGMKLSDLRVNWSKNLIKIWISLINEIRRINKFVDLIKLWFN
jgi:hypothetical protein